MKDENQKLKLQSNKTKKKLKAKITKVIKRIDLSTSKKKISNDL